MTKQKPAQYVAKSIYGTFTRSSLRVYTHAVVREDGWHMFCGREDLARKEFRYQENRVARGRIPLIVEMVPVEIVS